MYNLNHQLTYKNEVTGYIQNFVHFIPSFLLIIYKTKPKSASNHSLWGICLKSFPSYPATNRKRGILKIKISIYPATFTYIKFYQYFDPLQGIFQLKCPIYPRQLFARQGHYNATPLYMYSYSSIGHISILLIPILHRILMVYCL